MECLTPWNHVVNSSNAGTLSGRRWKVKAAVLPKITTKLPTLPDPFSAKSKQLQGLQLVDQRFIVPDSVGIVPDSVGILLDADLFSRVMLPMAGSKALQDPLLN